MPRHAKRVRESLIWQAIVASFKYVGPIKSPSRRDITVVDATDFNKMLRGGETVSINLVTDSSKDSPLNIGFRVYKIGACDQA